MSKRSTSSWHQCWLHQHHYHHPHPDHHNDHLNDGRPDGEALASLELGREREKASVLHVQVAVHLVKEGGRCYILLGDFRLKYLLSIWSRGGGEAVF